MQKPGNFGMLIGGGINANMHPLDLRSDDGTRRFHEAINKVMATHADVIKALAKR